MARGDVSPVTVGDAEDVYCVDTEMYGQPEYGAVYVIASDRPALIDTGIGTGYEAILDALADLGIAPRDLATIAPTHVHLDHAGGAGYLARECPNADVVVHERGARHLVDPSRLWEGTKRAVGDRIEHYAEPVPVPAERITEVSEGDRVAGTATDGASGEGGEPRATIDVGDRELSVHDAPGHAPHQAVFYDPESDGVFAADAAGIYTPDMDEPGPTTPPPDFDRQQCLADVELLQSLDPAAIYYAHYGPSAADDLLSAYARALEDWVGEIETAREELADDEAVVERFVAAADVPDGTDPDVVRGEVAMNVVGVLQSLDERED